MKTGRLRLDRLSLNQRIMLIVLVALLPLSIISLMQSARAREHLNLLAGERLAASANATAANQREGFNIARRMLLRASSDPDIVGATDRCTETIKAQLVAQQAVVNLARSDTQGNVLCSGISYSAGLSFAGQDWWQKGKAARRLTVSAPIMGPIAQRRLIIAMLPLYTAQGDYAGAITAGIDVAWLEDALTNLRLSRSAEVGIANASGTLIMHSSGFDIGKVDIGPNGNRFRTAQTADGSKWLYHVAPIFGQDLFVVFAEPEKRLLSFADTFWIQNLLLPIGTLFFASFAVWWGIQLFVVRWLDRLSLKARQIAQGDYHYDPARFTNAAPEIAEFAQTLHRMAEDIEAQKGRLASSLDHSRALTREINHRVKNNLQIILSLLHMQGSQTREPEARQIINQTLARMGAVSAAQRLTYEDSGIADVGHVDMVKLIAALVQQLRGTFLDKPHEIEVDCTVQRFPSDLAIPIALVIVEAVFNATTHGLGDKGGKIIIALHPVATGALLSIRDDGHGFDTAAMVGKLGMDLMQALAVQLNGTLIVNSRPNEGTEIQLNMIM
jgi:two-component sensor histidine kinase